MPLLTSTSMFEQNLEKIIWEFQAALADLCIPTLVLDLEPSRWNQINMTYTTDITIRTGQFRNSSFSFGFRPDNQYA